MRRCNDGHNSPWARQYAQPKKGLPPGPGHPFRSDARLDLPLQTGWSPSRKGLRAVGRLSPGVQPPTPAPAETSKLMRASTPTTTARPIRSSAGPPDLVSAAEGRRRKRSRLGRRTRRFEELCIRNPCHFLLFFWGELGTKFSTSLVQLKEEKKSKRSRRKALRIQIGYSQLHFHEGVEATKNPLIFFFCFFFFFPKVDK